MATCKLKKKLSLTMNTTPRQWRCKRVTDTLTLSAQMIINEARCTIFQIKVVQTSQLLPPLLIELWSMDHQDFTTTPRAGGKRFTFSEYRCINAQIVKISGVKAIFSYTVPACMIKIHEQSDTVTVCVNCELCSFFLR